MKSRTYIFVLSLSVLSLVAIVSSVTFAYFRGSLINTNGTITAKGGVIDLTVTNSAVNPTILMPEVDSNIQTSDVVYRHTFSVVPTASTNLAGCYKIQLVVDSIGSNLKSEYFKYKLSDGTNNVTGNFSPSSVTYTNNTATIDLKTNIDIPANASSKSYTLTLWLSYSDSVDQTSILTGSAQNRQMSGHIVVSGVNGACSS